jgi:fructose transport system substrate-binding protein
MGRTLTTRRRLGVLGTGFAVVLTLAACGGDDAGSSGSTGDGGGGDKEVVGLITKTDTNPFFVKMKEGAQAAADEAGMELQSYAGKQDGDNEAQVQAIESLISAGAIGFMITPSDSKAIVPSIDKARQAGLVVIALDTQTEPSDAVNATYATDNYEAGLLTGKWTAAKLGAEAANAKIAFLDLNANQVSVDVQRDQGFMEGFGIDVKDNTKIVGHDVTDGNEEGGRTAMENLLQKDPSITVVYTINEPAAAGAFEALKAAGKEKSVTIVSVDGGCPGVEAVGAGALGATSQQYPLKMAQLGVEAIAKFAEDGTEPTNDAGEDFLNTGVTLITDQPVDGVESQDSTWGRDNCWG